MNPKRRILLIAVVSWGAVGLRRRRSKNPIAAGLGLIKSSASLASSAARASYPVAKVSLRLARKLAWGAFRSLIWPKK